MISVRRRCTNVLLCLVSIGTTLGCSDEQNPAAPDPPGDTIPPPANIQLAARLVSSGFDAPLLLLQRPESTELLVVEQTGRVRAFEPGSPPQSPPYLDMSNQTVSGGERGLLGLAFHPRFSENGHVFASFTGMDGASTIVRYIDTGGPSINLGTGLEILRVAQPFSNHNGGHVAFGPDGMLYVGLGDGGGGGDPLESGQDLTTLLGSMLRIDVDASLGGKNYGIPPTNPFVGQEGARDEIWAFGLRNPWRFSFDSRDGWLYIGDVGQGAQEEISVVDQVTAGYNFGWNLKEGTLCFSVDPCDQPGLTDPVLTYPHSSGGCSVTGGYVYRGSEIPELSGTYFYSDFCAGWIRGFRLIGGVAQEQATWIESQGRVTSFGIDGSGEIYFLTTAGNVFQIVRQ